MIHNSVFGSSETDDEQLFLSTPVVFPHLTLHPPLFLPKGGRLILCRGSYYTPHKSTKDDDGKVHSRLSVSTKLWFERSEFIIEENILVTLFQRRIRFSNIPLSVLLFLCFNDFFDIEINKNNYKEDPTFNIVCLFIVSFFWCCHVNFISK